MTAQASASLLFGYGGTPAVDTNALTGILLRVSRLADDIPEIAEIDLGPVLAGAVGAGAVAARIRVCPAQSHDPFPRKLR